jgi:DNA-binding transcriptional MerR regulator
MKYRIKQLADLAGVTVRALQFYDKIGLLKPSFVNEKGYRFYEEADLLVLQKILFFKELDFSLKDIRQHLNSQNLDQILIDQKKMLELKRDRLDQLIENINNTIKMKGNNINGQIFTGFSNKKIEQYKKEAKKRWGNTEAFKQSEKRIDGWSKAGFQKIKKEGEDIVIEISQLMSHGAESQLVQEKIETYHKHINRFYDCDKEMFLSLGKMYSADERFSQYYNKVKSGLARFMTEAIEFYVTLDL